MALNDLLGINNPYLKLMPESNLSNDLISNPSPKVLHKKYSLNYLNGVLLSSKNSNIPWFVKKYAQYNFDFLKANQEDNQSIIFEETSYYRDIKDTSKGKAVYNHKFWMLVDPLKAGKGSQATGDCVSWAIRAALDELRSKQIVDGKWEAYITRQATCGIYSGRGHTGQGADPVALSAFAVKIGTLLEKVYKTSAKEYDFSDYNDYVNWGISRGRVGLPDDLLELTKKYTAAGYKVVATTDAAADLLYNGASLHCGSMLGVASVGNPISRRSGSWAHDMNVSGFDDTDEAKEQFGGRVWLWDNSWANWNTVTNIPDRWKPWMEGMFALSDKDTQYAFSDDGTCAFFSGKWFDAEPISNLLI